MTVTEETVRHVAELARLKLSDDEVKMYTHQFNDILEHFKDLDEVDTEEVRVTSQVTGLKNIFREDEIKDCPEEIKQKIFKEAPNFKDGYFVVPHSIKKHK